MCQRVMPVRMSCSRADQPPWKAKMWSVCSARSKELFALLHKVTRIQLGIESKTYARARPRPDSGNSTGQRDL